MVSIFISLIYFYYFDEWKRRKDSNSIISVPAVVSRGAGLIRPGQSYGESLNIIAISEGKRKEKYRFADPFVFPRLEERQNMRFPKNRLSFGGEKLKIKKWGQLQFS